MAENSAISWMRASTQADLERGIGAHLETPAAVRGLSLEPLLGPIDLRTAFGGIKCELPDGTVDGYMMPSLIFHKPVFGWAIVGCESGPKRRLSANEIDSHFFKASYLEKRWVSWLRDIIDQCDAAGVPVFVKQVPIANGGKIGWRVSKDPSEWPEWARRREYPKGADGDDKKRIRDS